MKDLKDCKAPTDNYWIKIIIILFCFFIVGTIDFNTM